MLLTRTHPMAPSHFEFRILVQARWVAAVTAIAASLPNARRFLCTAATEATALQRQRTLHQETRRVVTGLP